MFQTKMHLVILDGGNIGTLSVVKNNKNEQRVLLKEAGVVDYKKGEVILKTRLISHQL